MPTDAVGLLQDERKRLADELKRLDQAIDLLTKGKSPMGRSRSSDGGAKSAAASAAATKRWQPGGDLYEKRKAKLAEAEQAQIDAQMEAGKGKRGGRKKKGA